jgi:hypothetical protein
MVIVKEVETVDRTILVKIPKNYDKLLSGLASGLHMTVEEILLEEVYGILKNFFSGGFFQGWTDALLDDENYQDLEKEASQVADMVLTNVKEGRNTRRIPETEKELITDELAYCMEKLLKLGFTVPECRLALRELLTVSV